jgi:hydroxymethylbilane synthase
MTAAMPPPRVPLRVGTRGSPLALIQTRLVIDALRPHRAAEPAIIRTTGDAVQDRRLAELGGKGLFAKEIHEALLDGRIDLAMHSLKDLETELPPGIVLACTLPREDPRDALILGPDCPPADPAKPFDSLRSGAVLGTSSVRRQAQVLHARPDITIATLRGNVDTRLAKLAAGDCAATILAYAGLIRLGRADAVSVVLDPEAIVPAACQGVIGITARATDTGLRDVLASIADPDSSATSTAERALLTALDGSCHTPIGAFARLLPDGGLHVTGLVARPDGGFLLKRDLQGPVADAARIGRELGANLRATVPGDIFA